MFAAVPLLALPVLAYNIVVLTLAGGFGSQEATIRMTEPLFTIAMNSAAELFRLENRLMSTTRFSPLFFR